MKIRKYLIHTEKIWEEDVWKNLTEFLKKQGEKSHIFIMPPQYEYQHAVLGFRGSKKELNEILRKRCEELRRLREEYGFLIGIHLHVSIHCGKIPNKDKTKLLKDGLEWLSKFFKIRSIAFGWYKYDNHLKKICYDNNLAIIHYNFLSFNLHDYDLPPTKKKLGEEWVRAFLRRLK